MWASVRQLKHLTGITLNSSSNLNAPLSGKIVQAQCTRNHPKCHAFARWLCAQAGAVLCPLASHGLQARERGYADAYEFCSLRLAMAKALAPGLDGGCNCRHRVVGRHVDSRISAHRIDRFCKASDTTLAVPNQSCTEMLCAPGAVLPVVSCPVRNPTLGFLPI